MGFLAGKRILILGVASKLSIASGIAAAMHREGAELALTYQNEKLKGRVEGFAASWDSQLVFPCDVTSDEQISQLFEVNSLTYLIDDKQRRNAPILRGFQPIYFNQTAPSGGMQLH